MAESNDVKHQVNDEHEHSNAASEEEVIASQELFLIISLY